MEAIFEFLSHLFLDVILKFLYRITIRPIFILTGWVKIMFMQSFHIKNVEANKLSFDELENVGKNLVVKSLTNILIVAFITLIIGVIVMMFS